jgi:hypothetical protein
MLKEIWTATQEIKIIKATVNGFGKRLEKMEVRCNNVYHQRGIRFMNDHGPNIESVVQIFEKEYGYANKISGYDLVEKVLNAYAKTIARKNIFFVSVLNSLAFRFVEVISIIALAIFFAIRIL